VLKSALISSGFGEGRQLGIEAKFCELGDEAFGPHVLGAAVKVIGTEVLELGAIFDHVVDRREDRGRHRAHRLSSGHGDWRGGEIGH
jgi:hypothetical protein